MQSGADERVIVGHDTPEGQERDRLAAVKASAAAVQSMDADATQGSKATGSSSGDSVSPFQTSQAAGPTRLSELAGKARSVSFNKAQDAVALKMSIAAAAQSWPRAPQAVRCGGTPALEAGSWMSGEACGQELPRESRVVVCGEPPYSKPADPTYAEEQLRAASEDVSRGPTVMAPYPPPDAVVPTGPHADEPYTSSDCHGTSGPLAHATGRRQSSAPGSLRVSGIHHASTSAVSMAGYVAPSTDTLRAVASAVANRAAARAPEVASALAAAAPAADNGGVHEEGALSTDDTPLSRRAAFQTRLQALLSTNDHVQMADAEWLLDTYDAHPQSQLAFRGHLYSDSALMFMSSERAITALGSWVFLFPVPRGLVEELIAAGFTSGILKDVNALL